MHTSSCANKRRSLHRQRRRKYPSSSDSESRSPSPPIATQPTVSQSDPIPSVTAANRHAYQPPFRIDFENGRILPASTDPSMLISLGLESQLPNSARPVHPVP